MVPTVKILGLRVRFGIGDDVKLLPAFLRCFPSVERLHIEVRVRPSLHLAIILHIQHALASYIHTAATATPSTNL
jgi:hypothetical protein